MAMLLQAPDRDGLTAQLYARFGLMTLPDAGKRKNRP
jgi:hypothetical protein